MQGGVSIFLYNSNISIIKAESYCISDVQVIWHLVHWEGLTNSALDILQGNKPIAYIPTLLWIIAICHHTEWY